MIDNIEFENNIKLAENVVLVDVAYLNRVVDDLKGFFELKLKRSLPNIYVEEWVSYLALDAGLRGDSNKIDVLFVYDERTSRLLHCDPSDLKTELNGKGFDGSLGELSFSSICSEKLVSRSSLFLDLLSIALNSADVKRLMVVPFIEEYDDAFAKTLNEGMKEPVDDKSKSVFVFTMSQPIQPIAGKWDMLGFSIIKAMGVNPEELV